jgi:hypothetical protein
MPAELQLWLPGYLTPRPNRLLGGALGAGGQGTGQSPDRPIVRIVRCARQLLDPDNLAASVKFMVDRLCEAILRPGDYGRPLLAGKRDVLKASP